MNTIQKDKNKYTITNTLSTDNYCYISLTYHTDGDEPEIEIHKIIVNTTNHITALTITDDDAAISNYYHWYFYAHTLDHLLDVIELHEVGGMPMEIAMFIANGAHT